MSRRILIAGGGYVGLYAALVLQDKVKRDVEITLVSPESYMTYQPFLPEAAAGSLEPRHVVVPLRRVLPKVRVVNGSVARVDHQSRVATIEPLQGPAYEVGYDEIVVSVGSVARTLPIPGLADGAVGFKTIEEAIFLRNQVLECLDVAASADEATRREQLTFVFVGAGYAGIEAMAELEDLARYACRYYPTVEPADMRWVMVDAADRILPELSPGLAAYTVRQLESRGIEVFTSTRLESAVDNRIVLSNGQSFPAATLVWTAGVKANPVVNALGMPLDERGRIDADEFLRVRGVDGAWTAGDCAGVPDLANGGFCAPTAQHAVRQARRLGNNLAAHLDGQPPTAYRHKNVGSVASLGLYKGVAEVYGIRLRGFPAWFMHRTYHVSRVPTFNRKVRVLLDWTTALFFRREVVSLGALHRPRAAFEKSNVRLP
ncbi:MAG: NAD(P)/FAD-dependent oxidoreductase [Actinomycetota bacterium]